ncbi:hypothetical protein PWG15_22200 (plasmid) [Ensifer adhaerens]|uniref:hypothetical protein n=1 Tax=Ensifer adhaerens TaxID=106592 RepID=UPI0023A9C451|nr:hypothetical protein [Ensifer adhaerens]WDZ80498.1 hypothetical protein PWG15_22200 [Ensifer adhaerens]
MKINTGAVVEVPVSSGLAYAQCTHTKKPYGPLLRVFPGIFAVRPQDLSAVVAQAPLFSCFFPLGAAVRQRRVAIAEDQPVAEALRQFPLFRAGATDPATGKIGIWWLWDGENETRVGRLTPEQRKLDIRGVWNDTLLAIRIEQQWRPESDPC